MQPARPDSHKAEAFVRTLIEQADEPNEGHLEGLSIDQLKELQDAIRPFIRTVMQLHSAALQRKAEQTSMQAPHADEESWVEAATEYVRARRINRINFLVHQRICALQEKESKEMS